jgi:hypothetical protein
MGRALRPEDSEVTARLLIREEIDVIVADALAQRDMLRVGHHARRLAATYPASGLSERQIANEIVLVAMDVGVGAFEIGATDDGERGEPQEEQPDR